MYSMHCVNSVPVSCLKTDSKIVTAIQAVTKSPLVIHPAQSGFMTEYKASNNNGLAVNILVLHSDKNESPILASLDMGKTVNTLQIKFLEQVMNKNEFPVEFIF